MTTSGSNNNTVTAILRLKGQQAFSAGMKGAESSTKRLGHGFSSMGKAARVGFAAVGVAAAAGGVILARQVELGLTSLERIDRIHRQTVSALASTKNIAGVTADDIETLGTKIEGLTGSEQETTQMGQNMLLTFTNIRNGVGKGNDIFNQASMAMVDMGRAMDKTGDPLVDLNKTAIQLGKALNDPIKGVTALSKVGVSFNAGQKKTIKSMVDSGNVMGAQKIILAELNKEFGGSAKAFGGSLTGRIERVKHAYGTMQEQIASALLPTLEKTTNWALNKGIPLMVRFGNWALPRIQHGFKLVQPYAQKFLKWLTPLGRIFAKNDAGQWRKGMDSLTASLRRNSPWLKALGDKIRDGIVKYGPTVAKWLGKLAGFNMRALATGIGWGIDAIKYLSLGFVRFSRVFIDGVGTILHAATKAFGWVPGLGDKLRAADKGFADFRKGANTELDKIERTLTMKVDTTAATKSIADWRKLLLTQGPAVPGTDLDTARKAAGFVGPVIPGSTVDNVRKAETANKAALGVTVNSTVTLDGKTVGKSQRKDTARHTARR